MPRIERQLPKLIALPIPDFAKVKQPSLLLPTDYSRPQWKRSVDEMDYYDKAIAASIDALTAVINLTLMFLEDVKFKDVNSLRRSNREPSYPEAAKFWIKEVCDAIILLEEDLCQRGTDKEFGENAYDDDDDLAHFEDIFNGSPESTDSVVNLNSEIDKCTARMLEFWLAEIKRRGFELMSICLKTVDVDEAGRLFEEMKTIRYPVR